MQLLCIKSIVCIILTLCVSFIVVESQSSNSHQIGHVFTLDKSISIEQLHDSSNFWSSQKLPVLMQDGIVRSFAIREDLGSYTVQVYFLSRQQILTLYTFPESEIAEEFLAMTTNPDKAGRVLAQANSLRDDELYSFQKVEPYQKTVKTVPSTCTNGQIDGSETDKDCGGDCSPCMIANSCDVDSDCGGSIIECVLDKDDHEDDDGDDIIPASVYMDMETTAVGAGTCRTKNSAHVASLAIAITVTILAMVINAY